MSDAAPVESSPVDPVEAIASILEAENAPPEEDQVEAAPDEGEEYPVEDAVEDDGMDDVEYEGDQYRVPKQLKDALLRQADYTKKTQEVAEQRRALEARDEAIRAMEQQFQEQTQFHSAIMQDASQLQGLESTLKQYEGVDWQSFSDNDPVAAQKAWFQYQQVKNNADQLRNQIGTKQAQFQQWKQGQMQEALKKGMEILKKDIPNFNAEMQAKIRKTVTESYGFSPAELSNLYDARLVKLMADATAYRDLLANREVTNKRVANAPKTIQPGAKQSNSAAKTQARQESYARLKKSGRVEDAASVIAKLI